MTAGGHGAARARILFALAMIGIAAWATFATIWARWTGAHNAIRGFSPDVVAGILVPIGGACACAASLLAWRAARRDDFVGEPRRRGRYVAGLALGAWMFLLTPIGALVMHWSASVSKQRALVVATAVEAYRAKHDRWPESMEALAVESKDPLPKPTFRGRGFEVFTTRSGAVRVGFYAWGFTYSHSWEYDVVRKTWSEASQ